MNEYQELPMRDKTIPEVFNSSLDLVETINGFIKKKPFVEYLQLQYFEKYRSVPEDNGASILTGITIQLVHKVIKSDAPTNVVIMYKPFYQSSGNIILKKSYHLDYHKSNRLGFHKSKEHVLKELSKIFFNELVKHILFAKDVYLNLADGTKTQITSFQTILGLNGEIKLCEDCEEPYSTNVMLRNKEGQLVCPNCISFSEPFKPLNDE